MKLYLNSITNDIIVETEFDNGYISVSKIYNEKTLEYRYKFMKFKINNIVVSVNGKSICFICCHKLTEKQLKKLKNEFHRKMKQHEIS